MKYLYFYPDVHIWKDTTHVLFYNTRSRKQMKVKLDDELQTLYYAVTDIENMYCVPLLDSSSLLIGKLTENEFARVIECHEEERPIAFPPYHIFNESYLRNENLFNEQVLELVKTLRIYLGGTCIHNCHGCDSLYKQIPYCYQSNCHLLQGENASLVMGKIRSLNNLKKIDIVLTDAYRDVMGCISSFTIEGALIIYHINFRNVTNKVLESLITSKGTVLVKILIDIQNLSRFQYEQILKYRKKYKDHIILVLCVNDLSDVSYVESHFLPDENCEVRFVYSGKTIEHIQKHYLLNVKELEHLSADHNCIFGNRELNFALFGELVVFPDGTIKLNENTEVIGTIEDNWTDMLNKALNKPNPWLLTRNKIEPCSYCIYRDLCPPIRNLELYMGDKLACVDYYKTLVKPESDNN